MSNVRDRTLLGTMFVIVAYGASVVLADASESELLAPEYHQPNEGQPADDLSARVLIHASAEELQTGAEVVQEPQAELLKLGGVSEIDLPPLKEPREVDREAQNRRWREEQDRRWREEQIVHQRLVRRLQETADKQYAAHIRSENERMRLQAERDAAVAREAQRFEMERARNARAQREAAEKAKAADAAARAKLAREAEQARADLARKRARSAANARRLRLIRQRAQARRPKR